MNSVPATLTRRGGHVRPEFVQYFSVDDASRVVADILEFTVCALRQLGLAC